MSQKDTTQGSFKPIASPPTDLDALLAIESALVVPQFTHEDAFTLGLALRQRLINSPKPTVVRITHANSNQILFHCVNGSGTSPDNDVWVSRKTNTVLRFGTSSHYMGTKLGADEKLFAAKYGLSPESASTYAIHGGAVPVRVRGVEGTVAVVCVSGLKSHEDHAVVVEVMGEWIKALKA